MLYCPKCAGESSVLRSFDDVRTVSRLRRCKRCGYAFTTTEIINVDMQSFVEVHAQKVKDEQKRGASSMTQDYIDAVGRAYRDRQRTAPCAM